MHLGAEKHKRSQSENERSIHKRVLADELDGFFKESVQVICLLKKKEVPIRDDKKGPRSVLVYDASFYMYG